MTDMMHSTTAVVAFAIFLVVVIVGLVLAVRVMGERVRSDEENDSGSGRR